MQIFNSDKAPSSVTRAHSPTHTSASITTTSLAQNTKRASKKRRKRKKSASSGSDSLGRSSDTTDDAPVCHKSDKTEIIGQIDSKLSLQDFVAQILTVGVSQEARNAQIRRYIAENAHTTEEKVELLKTICQHLPVNLSSNRGAVQSSAETAGQEALNADVQEPANSAKRVPNDADMEKRIDSKMDLMEEEQQPLGSNEFKIPRCDFYQDSSRVNLAVYMPGLSYDDTSVNIQDRYIQVQCKSLALELTAFLDYPVDPFQSTFSITKMLLSFSLLKDGDSWRSAPKLQLCPMISTPNQDDHRRYLKKFAKEYDRKEISEEDFETIQDEQAESQVPSKLETHQVPIQQQRSDSAPPLCLSEQASSKLYPIYKTSLDIDMLRVCRSASLERIPKLETKMDNIMYDRQTAKCGLYNEGIDCFMNTIIQCLASIPEFVDYFVDKTYMHHINTQSALSKSKGAVAHSFAALLDKLFTSKEAFVPTNFKHIVEKYWGMYDPYQQQDAQEFFNYILDTIHEDVNKVRVKPYIEIGDYTDSSPNDEVSKVFWDAHKQRNDSVVVDLFHGQYRSQITCSACSSTSVKFEAFMNISVDIPESSMITQFYIVSSSQQINNCRLNVPLNATFEYLTTRIKLLFPNLLEFPFPVAVSGIARDARKPIGSDEFVLDYERNALLIA